MNSNELSEEQLITYDELVAALHDQIVETAAEHIRRKAQREINEDALPLEELKARHGEVWTLDELRQQFEIIQFSAPLVVVRRRSDDTLGSVWFQHHPRFYWGFKEDRV